MAQSKILLDSNTYFRLAKSIHPLLFCPFGRKEYCLYVAKELDDEYCRSPRLRTKFAWVDDAEFRENRKQRLTLSRSQRNTELPTVYEFLWDQAINSELGVSRVDVTVLAYGYVLNIPVITDDRDMQALAQEYGVEVWTTLELLHLMLEESRIDMSKIRQIAGFWGYEQDLPADFVQDYSRLFGESPPV
ncbi:MAG: DNA-binding protein [Candidatus Thiodiazotropha sp. (ex Monitilora ramsayi)]|nr:DNA-binding protein [Candidatus Thiodiazotropha sp. (ex Monitilora ramsayi)]